MTTFETICRGLAAHMRVVETPARPDPITAPPRSWEELLDWFRSLSDAELRRAGAMAVDEGAFFIGQMRCLESYALQDVMDNLRRGIAEAPPATAGGYEGGHTMELALRLLAAKFAAGHAIDVSSVGIGTREPLSMAHWGVVAMQLPWRPDDEGDVYSVGMFSLLNALRDYSSAPFTTNAEIVARLVLMMGAAFALWTTSGRRVSRARRFQEHTPVALDALDVQPTISSDMVAAFVRRWWARVERIPRDLE